jgi:hypothetical protein
LNTISLKSLNKHSTKGSDDGTTLQKREHEYRQADIRVLSDVVHDDRASRRAVDDSASVKARLADAGYTDAEIAASLEPARAACRDM